MTPGRLEQHYLQLLAAFPRRSVVTTLQVLADTLGCTRRHMRTLVIKMAQKQWLSWHSSAGRGHMGTLTLHLAEQEMMLLKAEQYLLGNDINNALKLVGNNPQHITRLLRSRLGHSIQDDQQSLCIPYYRSMLNLCPGTPLRRSEMYLVKQIFSGLTKTEETHGQVVADLAHHWRQLDPCRWRFYLRPGVLFHDGSELTSNDVASSLMRSATLPLFSHIRKVSPGANRCVEITLSHPDPHLPLLLSDVGALILPADHPRRMAFARYPVGSGPYKVIDNNDWHLHLRAFSGYFGLRGLLDNIEILTGFDFSDPATQTSPLAWLSSSVRDLDYTNGETRHVTGTPGDASPNMFLERGGYFILCDSRSAHWQQAGSRRWLRTVLDPGDIVQQFVKPVRPLWSPANSLLPEWFHLMDQSVDPVSPAFSGPATGRLRLACHTEHPEFPMLISAFTRIFSAAGITLETQELNYQDWAHGNAEADLWLGTVNFYPPEVWNTGSWLLGMPLLRYGISGGDGALLDQWQQQWREGVLPSEQLAARIIQSGWLQPLFHHWMRINSPNQAQGIQLNNLGWFDFSKTWLEPEDN